MNYFGEELMKQYQKFEQDTYQEPGKWLLAIPFLCVAYLAFILVELLLTVGKGNTIFSELFTKNPAFLVVSIIGAILFAIASVKLRKHLFSSNQERFLDRVYLEYETHKLNSILIFGRSLISNEDDWYAIPIDSSSRFQCAVNGDSFFILPNGEKVRWLEAPAQSFINTLDLEDFYWAHLFHLRKNEALYQQFDIFFKK